MIKLFTLFTATLAITAGAASADSRFSFNEVQGSDSIVELGTVVADGNGVVEIHELSAGQQGRLLGTDAIHAGANSDVSVSLDTTAMNDFVAVLKIDGQVVTEQVVRTNNNG